MVNLFQYFDEDKWMTFVSYVSKDKAYEDMYIYNYLTELNIFPDDINIVLSSLYEYMFYSNIDVFVRWLRTKIKMLDKETPIEATKKIDSCNSLREFLMRSP